MPTTLRSTIVAGLICLLAAPAASATTFDLLGLGTDLPSPLMLTQDGIQLTLSGSVFNSTATSFGMGIDNSYNDPFLIDASETVFMIFDRDVYLDSVLISSFDDQDSGVLLFKGVASFPLTNGPVDAGGIRLIAGSSSNRVVSTIGLPASGTRGFSLDQITVRVVPEPATLNLAMLALLGLSFNRVRVSSLAFGRAVR
jgi:hypothetical protein